MMKIPVMTFLIICLFSGGSLSGPAPVESLTEVGVETVSETSALLSIECTGEVKYHVFRVSDPPRLVIEMVNTRHKWEQKQKQASDIFIKRVRSGQYRSEPVNITRVVLDMVTDKYEYTDSREDNRIKVGLELTPEGIEKLVKTEDHEEPEPEEVRKPRPPAPELKPNIPTPEHKTALDEIERKKQERKLREREVQELKEFIREKDILEEDEPVPGTLVGKLSDEKVEFNFRAADIREILRTFALKLEKNMITADDVTGNVSLRLRNVPFDEAFQILLSRMDLVAIQRSPNVIEVIKSENMPVERKTFNLISRSATDISETLDELMTPAEKANTTIAVDRTSNSLVITATPAVLRKLDVLIKQMDIKSPQIKIKARIIEIMDSLDSRKGVSWLSSIPWRQEGDTEYSGLAGMNVDSFRLEWDDTQQRMVPGEPVIPGDSGVMEVSAIIDDISLNAILSLLATETRSKTVSEPNIITENNRGAKIHVGRNLPVRTTRTDEVGYTQTVEFITEGVTLDVTPVVSPGSDQIALDLNVSVSEFVGFQADMPMTMDRSATTQVTVESGKTIVIGGLIRERMSDSDTGIPLLKDIPLLGYLFKNRTTGKERNELLVFLTPEIVQD